MTVTERLKNLERLSAKYPTEIDWSKLHKCNHVNNDSTSESQQCVIPIVSDSVEQEINEEKLNMDESMSMTTLNIHQGLYDGRALEIPFIDDSGSEGESETLKIHIH